MLGDFYFPSFSKFYLIKEKDMEDIIVLQKGEEIQFLDYTIFNSRNNDGLVLMKKGETINYEYHLGNYGTGTQENIDTCKRYAILYFMTARPEKFATTLVNKMMRLNSGIMHEFYAFVNVCLDENIKVPEEITGSKDMNAMILFKGQPLAKEPKKEVILFSEDYIKQLEHNFNILVDNLKKLSKE